MRGSSRKTLELIDFAYGLLAASHPMTLRQLHYTIFSAAKIDYKNTEADYKRLSRASTTARRRHREAELNNSVAAYGIPHEWIVDELREGERVSLWGDLKSYMNTVRASYRRDNWQDQPTYCEIWSEKATVLATLRPVTQELGVTLRACRGFGSAGMEGQIGYLLENIGKLIHIFYLGDHDPSGHEIERDIHMRTQEASGKTFAMTRLAIHPDDIQHFRLPPQKIKLSDSRSASFQRRFGKEAPSIELDALPVEELRSRVRRAIEGLIDVNRWNRQIAIQQVELNCISDFVRRVRTLPPWQEGA